MVIQSKIQIPEVSVVMSVYNGEKHLRGTIDSVLSQEGVEFEFIIVNDGSTDTTPDILEHYAAHDRRIRLIHQRNQGLTVALINGCAIARGKFIARQDCGDISLPSRLAAQAENLSKKSNASIVSCGVRTVTREGHLLHENIPPQEGATEGLLATDLASVRGPAHHGCTMFPRHLYETVGGYRKEFYFAQDLDLWSRLAEKGRHLIIPKIYYQSLFTANSITGRFRNQQITTAKLIFACALNRRKAISEELFLRRAFEIRPPKRNTKASRYAQARAYYFVGSCLSKNGNPAAKKYFIRTLQCWPLHLKALFAFRRCL